MQYIDQEALAPLILGFALRALGVLVGLLLLYLVIRLAITHGMKSYTRWIDDGKP